VECRDLVGFELVKCPLFIIVLYRTYITIYMYSSSLNPRMFPVSVYRSIQASKLIDSKPTHSIPIIPLDSPSRGANEPNPQLATCSMASESRLENDVHSSGIGHGVPKGEMGGLQILRLAIQRAR
jgi:hypothetical protein